MSAKKKVGKKSSFMCSHVDSLTAEMGARAGDFVQSKRKCNKVPSTAVNVRPASCHKNKCFLIKRVYSKGKKDMFYIQKMVQKKFFKNFKFFFKKVV